MRTTSTGIVRSTGRSEEHTSELQSPCNLVCRLLLEKKNEDLMNAPPTTTLDSGAEITWSPSNLTRIHIGPSAVLGTEAGCLLFAHFFFNDTATTKIYTLSLHDALPISDRPSGPQRPGLKAAQAPRPGSQRP